MLAGRATLVTACVLPDVAANPYVPAEFDDRLTVAGLPLVVGLLKASSRVTVKALVADVLALPLNGVDVMASWVPVPAVMVSCWVTDKPVEVAVMVGCPTLVSP